MHFVKSVKYMSGYILQIAFEDGSIRLVNLENALHGSVFQPLKDLTIFRQVRIDPDLETITWPNGADIAPEYLYEHGIPIVE